jgi:hypothetical protein
MAALEFISATIAATAPMTGRNKRPYKPEANAEFFIQSLVKRGTIKLFSSFVLVEEIRWTNIDRMAAEL